MAKAWCDTCDQLVGISPTGERRDPDRGTCTWWKLDLHKVKGQDKICDDSGKKV